MPPSLVSPLSPISIFYNYIHMGSSPKYTGVEEPFLHQVVNPGRERTSHFSFFPGNFVFLLTSLVGSKYSRQAFRNKPIYKYFLVFHDIFQLPITNFLVWTQISSGCNATGPWFRNFSFPIHSKFLGFKLRRLEIDGKETTNVLSRKKKEHQN